MIIGASRGIGLASVRHYREPAWAVTASACSDDGVARVTAQGATALASGARLAVISSRMGSIGLRTAHSGWLYRASKSVLNSVLKNVSLAGRASGVAFHPGWVRTDRGGAGADIDVGTHLANTRRTLAGLAPGDNGGYLNHDGQALAW